MPQPIKSFIMPTINVYTDKILKPALEHNYIVFLLPTMGHSRELFLLLQRHARTRVMVRRKENTLTTVYEDDIEYEYEQLTQSVMAQIYGITDYIIPNPSRIVLNSIVKYSGYNTTDEWIKDFCSSVSRNIARRLSYLCLHNGNAKKWHNNKTTSVYTIAVLVEKIKR